MPEKLYVDLKAVIIKEEKALILKGTDPNDNIVWDLPGGRLEAGETHEEGFLRELQEELPGIQNVQVEKVISAYKTTLASRDGTFLFLVIYKITADLPQVTLSDEHTDYKWVDRKALEELEQTDPTPLYERFKVAIEEALTPLT